MNIMDFIYDYFYDVLSQEGIWVLILIGAAFAVASFILLTMRTETGFKYRDAVNQTVKSGKLKNNKKKEQEVEDVEPLADINKTVKPEKEKKSKGKKQDIKEQPSAPLRPQMVPPEQPEEEASLSVIDSVDITGVESLEPAADVDAGSPDTAQETVPAANQEGNDEAISVPAMEAPDLSAGVIDPVAIAVDLPQAEQELVQLAEEIEEAEGKPEGDSDDIFAIFDEVDDEEVTETALFAQELDDVPMEDMLSETENITQDLKNIFNQFRRA